MFHIKYNNTSSSGFINKNKEQINVPIVPPSLIFTRELHSQRLVGNIMTGGEKIKIGPQGELVWLTAVKINK